MKTIKCTKTGNVLPITEFRTKKYKGKDGKEKTQRLTYCKAWEKEQSKRYAQVRKNTFEIGKNKFTVGFDKNDRLVYKQDGKRIGKKVFNTQLEKFKASGVEKAKPTGAKIYKHTPEKVFQMSK